MLVLVSFGLVLLATILLVVGLLSDDGLTLIYISIACSATAAVVLYLAFRMARPKGERDATPPEPIAGGPADEEAYPDDPTRVGPAVASPVAEAPAAAAPAPVTTAVVERDEPVAEPAPADTADQGWAEQGLDEAGWDEAGEPDFPIADYDELKVSEIMPLLPQLYSDELEIVAERERSTKNRATILGRLAELEEQGTEADALEEMAEAETATVEAGEPEAFEPPPAPAPAPAPEPETRVVPAVAPAVSLSDDEDDDYLFPIADYDELSVGQIMPLLPQLELDELEEVKERELTGAGRKSLITEIDRYLSGELEPFAWDEDDDDAPAAAAPAPAPEPVVEPERAAPAATALPIADYDDRNVADIRPLLADLSPAELEAVLDHEVARDNRKTIVNDIQRRLGSPAPAPAPRATPRRRKATPKKVAAKKTARKARKATKKAAAPRFPIAGYDDLTVADIRPRLTDLSDRELRQVREREASGAGRKTILKDIDNRLS